MRQRRRTAADSATRRSSDSTASRSAASRCTSGGTSSEDLGSGLDWLEVALGYPEISECVGPVNVALAVDDQTFPPPAKVGGLSTHTGSALLAATVKRMER